jgi:hypothetical protein
MDMHDRGEWVGGQYNCRMDMEYERACRKGVLKKHNIGARNGILFPLKKKMIILRWLLQSRSFFNLLKL